MSAKFDVERFSHMLQTSWLGHEFIYLEKTDSTNSYLKKIPSRELIHGTVTLTDHQEKGRGQYERRWEAEPFKNLTFTIAFRPKLSDRFNLLSLAVAYSITEVLEEYLEDSVCLKWPNDILINGKKIGGLLTECTFNGSKPDRVLIGLGLNVGQTEFSNEINSIATSLKREANHSVEREELLNKILLSIENVYHRWHKQDEILKQDISKKILGYGEWVDIDVNGVVPNQKFKFIGVNSNGELLMLNEQLDVNKFIYEQVRIITGHQIVSQPGKNPSV
ncbi:biotin--[acetyl-CoA-carboxylase] ligase [Rhodohalobacter sulfatireducens]|uniref:Biotin--[acetyl-CoA-carboxylase] ligase n=1 Tax=Rhodohalobacter sulfatireducens TaxID=2911366 RepID=A0ABS9KE86_9BACT|nr:biotin--[acetyl-CoA-carboxylase] ligase [Rhodohalobacter sulfatireducens]MCG2589140.1 biotin--[acetyl-CoA-carboxylase] ligase [Rhodohalobacter sulfatireducens]